MILYAEQVQLENRPPSRVCVLFLTHMPGSSSTKNNLQLQKENWSQSLLPISEIPVRVLLWKRSVISAMFALEIRLIVWQNSFSFYPCSKKKFTDAYSGWRKFLNPLNFQCLHIHHHWIWIRWRLIEKTSFKNSNMVIYRHLLLRFFFFNLTVIKDVTTENRILIVTDRTDIRFIRVLQQMTYVFLKLAELAFFCVVKC